MTDNLAINAMNLNEKVHEENGIKIQGGKTYTKVVHRIEAFRRTVGYSYGINTDVSVIGNGVMAKAVITDSEGRVIGAGSSFATGLNKNKALEKLETTAIGRALASLGLGGDEYASIDEIDTHKERYSNKEEKPKPVSGEELNGLIEEIQASLTFEELDSAKQKARAAYKRMVKPQKDMLNKEVKIAEERLK